MLNQIVQMGLTRWRYIGLALSALLTCGCIWILWSKGLHLGLDFTGGVLLELKIQTLQSAAELNARLSPELAQILELQPAGVPGEWLIKLSMQELITPAAELAQQGFALCCHVFNRDKGHLIGIAVFNTAFHHNGFTHSLRVPVANNEGKRFNSRECCIYQLFLNL